MKTGNSFALRFGTGLALAFVPLVLTGQTAPAPTDRTEAKPAEDSYQTLYLTNLNEANDANDITTDLRNLLPKARIYMVLSQGAISIRGSAEDIALARKLLSDLDRIQKTYRLTYTITETDNGKRVGVQHFALVVVSGQITNLKQGTKVPLVVGEIHPEAAKQGSNVQYLDVGLNIQASISTYLDGVRLRTKIEQSTLAEEQSGVGAQDPLIRQALFEGTSTLVQGKPLVLGALDIPGSTRHQEIEVVSEQIR